MAAPVELVNMDGAYGETLRRAEEASELEEQGRLVEHAGRILAHISHLRERHGVTEWDALQVKPRQRGFDGDLFHSVYLRGREGALDRFIALADARPSTYLWFAKKYGLLHLCAEHLLPHGRCDRDAPWDLFVVEPIAVWRHFSRQAGAILRSANKLHRGELPSFADWKTIYEWSDWQNEDPCAGHFGAPGNEEHFNSLFTRLTLDGARMLMNQLVNEWLKYGRVQAEFWWPRDGGMPRMELVGGSGLFGELAREMAQRVMRARDYIPCFGCGTLYKPLGRRPNASQKPWCTPCKNDGADARHRQQEKRTRDRNSTARL